VSPKPPAFELAFHGRMENEITSVELVRVQNYPLGRHRLCRRFTSTPLLKGGYALGPGQRAVVRPKSVFGKGEGSG
jgi:hypothetical protein